MFPADMPAAKLPEVIQEITEQFYKTAAAQVAEGKAIPHTCLVGDMATGTLIPVVGLYSTPEEKDQFSSSVKVAAKMIGANYVVSVFECYSVRAPTKEAMDEVIASGIPISQHPDRIEQMMFLVETFTKSYTASCTMENKTLSPLKFVESNGEGRMCNFLDKSQVH